MTYETRLRDLAAQGATATAAHAALVAGGMLRDGIAPSLATVGRDLRAIRGPQRMRGKAVPAALAPDEQSSAVAAPGEQPAPVATPGPLPTEEEIGETNDPRTLDAWLAVAGRAAVAAENRGDPVALARFGSLATAILAAKAKAEPPPVVEPAKHPDMVAAAKACREKLFGMLERLIVEAEAGAK